MTKQAAITAPTRPVLRWHGGKWLLAQWIIDHFPPPRDQRERCAGGTKLDGDKPCPKCGATPSQQCGGLSGFGVGDVHLMGDSKSVASAQAWFHEAEKAPALYAEIQRLRLQWTGMKDEIRLCHEKIGRLNKHIANLTYALERVKHGAEYCDELGGIIDDALTSQQRG